MAKAAAASKNKEPHPPYLEMICEAISTLKDRAGSSQPAIAKFIDDKYGKMLPPNFKKLLSAQLNKLVKSEKLVKLNNCYKISSTEKLKRKKKEETASAKNKSPKPKEKAAEKSVKTKRLSQVKTPEALKIAKNDVKKKPVPGSKVKRLSQVNTPEGLKRKTKK